MCRKVIVFAKVFKSNDNKLFRANQGSNLRRFHASKGADWVKGRRGISNVEAMALCKLRRTPRWECETGYLPTYLTQRIVTTTLELLFKQFSYCLLLGRILCQFQYCDILRLFINTVLISKIRHALSQSCLRCHGHASHGDWWWSSWAIGRMRRDDATAVLLLMHRQPACVRVYVAESCDISEINNPLGNLNSGRKPGERSSLEAALRSNDSFISDF